MFSFVRRLFGKSKAKKEAEVEVVEVPEGAPTPYSLDFKGADEIMVSAADCSRKNVVAVKHQIVRPERIAKIVTFLAELPTKGKKRINSNPCTEHSLTALKGGKAFAQVVFYEGALMLENKAFIDSDEKALKMQAELFEIIKIEV